MSLKNILVQFQKSRQVTTALIIALFLSVSYLSYGVYIRFDLSDEGQFRITSASTKILRSLPDPVIIEAFFSSDVPNAFVQRVKNLKDFLQEYANASRGKVRLVFLDPDNDKDAKDRAISLGIQAAQVGQLDTKKQELRSAYYSVAVTYGDKTETIQHVLQTRQLEYELTARIQKLANPGERRIAFLTNHGPYTLISGQNTPPWHSMRSFSQAVEAFYGNIMEIDTKNQEIPDEVSVLLVVGPESLSDIDKLRIDQFIMRGGNVIFSISGMMVNFQNFMATGGNSEAIEFFKHYGFEVGNDLLFDLSPNGSRPWVQQIDFFQAIKIPYPVWLMVGRGGLAQDNPITTGLAGLFVPYTSSVKIDGNIINKEKGFKVDVLVQSSGQTIAKQNFVMLDPRQMEAMTSGEEPRASQNVAIYAKGRFSSYFANRPLPKDAPKNITKEATAEATLIAVGSPFVFTDFPGVGVLRCPECIQANLNFLISAIDVMNGLEELSELRKKEKTPIAMRNISQTTERWLTFISYILPLVTLLVIGTLRLMRRKKLAQEGHYGV